MDFYSERDGYEAVWATYLELLGLNIMGIYRMSWASAFSCAGVPQIWPCPEIEASLWFYLSTQDV
jgi:hypothetical protein